MRRMTTFEEVKIEILFLTIVLSVTLVHHHTLDYVHFFLDFIFH